MNLGDVRALHEWIRALEGEHFEFKEGKTDFNPDKLARYCCALANEGGGRLILGVTDRRPRRVVGTAAFPQIEHTRRTLMGKIPLRIDVREIHDEGERVLVFEVPPRPIGVPIKYDGRYWSRKADELEPLSEEKLRLIFAESGHDFSADLCPGVGIEHLDPQAIENFRGRWIAKSRNAALKAKSREELLRDAELLFDNGATYAALILFGTHAALGRFLGQAEVVFEYRSSEASGPAQHREEYRRGFFAFYDDLWSQINLRNDLQHYQDGLFVLDIPTFEERSVREGVLNAVSHRDYRHGGNVFVRQYPRRLVIESPGGLPFGITTENILDTQLPRNRRIADVFARCGLVERSGQGMNLMFEQSIRQGKARPEFVGSDAFNVVLTLDGTVRDPRFVRCMEEVSAETGASFGTHDLLVIDLIHRETPVPPSLRARLPRLVELGLIEKIGRGRGSRLLLSRRFFASIGRQGSYTRRRGLDRAENKALLLRHLRDNDSTGCPISELQQVLPTQSRAEIKRLLDLLKEEGHVRLVGSYRFARWFPNPLRANGSANGSTNGSTSHNEP